MIKNILFDFDGVILDSMPVRGFGFREIFKSYDKNLVDSLIEYHTINGGLSRYIKIRYFYEELLNEAISDEKVLELAEEFSLIMKSELTKKKYLISQTCKFVEENYKKYNFHIVSGSDEKELQYLCKELGLADYFITINGSPTHKNILVENVLDRYNYLANETILIGDSINDYEAAKINNLDFYGFNNLELEKYSKSYITEFSDFLFFDYGIGEISHSNENKTFYNIKKLDNIDYLVFFDSRGLAIDENEYNDTILYKMKENLDLNNKTYIIISRPKNLTILATLINFLNLNKNLKFKNLITNLGFVDMTPKRKVFVHDINKQIVSFFDENMKIQEISPYQLTEGKVEILCSLIYTDDYIDCFRKRLLDYNFIKMVFVNTLIVDYDFDMERNRPIEFFERLKETNLFLEKIVDGLDNSTLLDINKENIFTYDAVHYKRTGHLNIFDEIIKILN